MITLDPVFLFSEKPRAKVSAEETERMLKKVRELARQYDVKIVYAHGEEPYDRR